MVVRTQDELNRIWSELKTEHTHDRDSCNNYSSYNVERCQGCNFLYNSRGCTGCSDGDGLIECVQCVDCRNCAYCIGLNGARFHILNKEYREEEYYNQLRLLRVKWEVEAY